MDCKECGHEILATVTNEPIGLCIFCEVEQDTHKGN